MARLAQVIFGLTLVVAACIAVLLVTGRARALDLLPALAGLVYAFVGRLLTTRRPDNAVSWVIALIGLDLASAGLVDAYLASAPSGDPEWAFQLAAWFGGFAWNIWLFGLAGIALPLLFPDGRLPSRRWRWVARVAVVGAVLAMLAAAFKPGDLESPSGVTVLNPIGVDAAESALTVAGDLGSLLMTLATLASLGAVVVRLRRSRGVERQQVKVFAYVMCLILGGLLVAVVCSEAAPDAGWTQVVAPIGWFLALGMVAFGIPVATAIAVLRHRLYDIDVVIKRTLVYTALTATLGATYLGTVLLLQLVLSPSSDLAIAASTLAVAALFRPARSRIQEGVDRRFYRRRYDAGLIVESFGGRLRDEVALDALSADLRGVVAETMQPAHVTLWLRDFTPKG